MPDAESVRKRAVGAEGLTEFKEGDVRVCVTLAPLVGEMLAPAVTAISFRYCPVLPWP